MSLYEKYLSMARKAYEEGNKSEANRLRNLAAYYKEQENRGVA